MCTGCIIKIRNWSASIRGYRVWLKGNFLFLIFELKSDKYVAFGVVLIILGCVGSIIKISDKSGTIWGGLAWFKENFYFKYFNYNWLSLCVTG